MDSLSRLPQALKMAQLKICPSCQETLPILGDAFCTFCHEPLPEESKLPSVHTVPDAIELPPPSEPKPLQQLRHDSFRRPRPDLGIYISSYPSIKSESVIWKLAIIGLIVNCLFVAIPLSITAFCIIFGSLAFTWFLIAWKFKPYKAQLAISGLVVFENGIRVIKNGPEYSINYDQIDQPTIGTTANSGIRLKLHHALDFTTNLIAKQSNALDEINKRMRKEAITEPELQGPPITFQIFAGAIALIGILGILYFVLATIASLYFTFAINDETWKLAAALFGVNLTTTFCLFNLLPFAKSINTSNRYAVLIASAIVPTITIVLLKSTWFILESRFADEPWISLCSITLEIMEWFAFGLGCVVLFQAYRKWQSLRCSCFLFEPGFYTGLRKHLAGRYIG